MSLSPFASHITMPPRPEPYPSILDFLWQSFPNIQREIWHQRILDGKVLNQSGIPISLSDPYQPGKQLIYFREVAQEPIIPFSEEILFQNEHLLVADKPHFLPVNPGGIFVNECLLHRLRKRTGNKDIIPLHRIDRETAGLVLFSTNPDTRDLYHELFRGNRIEKKYQALARVPERLSEEKWLIENRLERGVPRFRMAVVPGDINARSHIKLIKKMGEVGSFELQPITGKTHQLRVHMSELGFPILNDRHYPILQPKAEDDFKKPLKLLANELGFVDPVDKIELRFCSKQRLPSGKKLL